MSEDLTCSTLSTSQRRNSCRSRRFSCNTKSKTKKSGALQTIITTVYFSARMKSAGAINLIVLSAISKAAHYMYIALKISLFPGEDKIFLLLEKGLVLRLHYRSHLV